MRTILLVLCLLAIGAGAARWPRHSGSGIATLTVSKTRFTRRVTAEGNLRAVHATPITVPQVDGWGGMKIGWLAGDGTAVEQGDVIARFDSSDAEKRLREATIDLETANAQLRAQQLRARADANDHEAAARVAAQAVDAAYQDAASDPMLYSHNEIAKSALDEKVATAHRAEAERARGLARNVAAADVELAALDKQRAQLAVDRSQKALANLEVHAPARGIVVLHRDERGDVPRVGAQVYGDQELAEIPALDAMEAETFVLEVDGSGLAEGQEASVIVDSHPDVAYHGTIRLVDKLAKPREMWVPVQYFTVVIALDHTEQAVMKPGQRVHATLVLDHEDAIVVPRQAVFENDGKAIVYRRTDHGFAPTIITLGAATPGRVAIASGLAAGDVIASSAPQGAP